MLKVPVDVQTGFDQKLDAVGVARPEQSEYRKWLRFYLDFCGKYGFDPNRASSLPPFQTKLASKNQSSARQAQAGRAVNLYYAMAGAAREMAVPDVKTGREDGGAREATVPAPRNATRVDAALETSRMQPVKQEGGTGRSVGASRAASAPPARGASRQAQYEALNKEVAVRNYSPKTQETYRGWSRKFRRCWATAM